MAKKERKPKLIKHHDCSLNILDPWQKQLHDHIESHTNKSEYLKSLVQRDMLGAWSSGQPSVHALPEAEHDFHADQFV